MIHKRHTFSAEFKRAALDLWNNTDRSAGQVETALGLTKGILYKQR